MLIFYKNTIVRTIFLPTYIGKAVIDRAEIFGSRNFSTGEFLAKIVGNPNFFKGKGYFFYKSLLQYFMYGSPN